MAGDITLRTVLVGLDRSSDGVGFDIEFDKFDIKNDLPAIEGALRSYFRGSNVDVHDIIDSYKKTPPVLRKDGSPFDVIASGPTVFLYVINTKTANNWRFTEGGDEYQIMCRKIDAKIPPELFDDNWSRSFMVTQDTEGVTMFGIFGKCTDFDPPGAERPRWRFGFDICMQVKQSDGRVTLITIDPDNDNQGNT